MKIIAMQAGLESFAGPGRCNDPDMLEVGNGGMTDNGGGRAVVLLNRGTVPGSVTVTWEQLRYPESLKATVRDLWLHKTPSSAQGRTRAATPVTLL